MRPMASSTSFRQRRGGAGLRANTQLMNSWQAFPNGRWLVFSSKSRGPTRKFLTHLDEDGNSSPAILIDDATRRTVP